MKNKFNWGTGILIVIAIFLLAILLVVRSAFKQKINLVSEDYYPKELIYQEVIDKKKNVKKYSKEIVLTELESKIYLIFPDSLNTDSVSGNIHFYRPSDYEKDILYTINLNDSLTQVFNTSEFIRGKYKVIVDWEHAGVEYYQELSLFIK